MGDTPDRAHTCPYCGRKLHWIPQRWFGRGTYECVQCGDFPDLTAEDIRACLAFAADRERRLRVVPPK